MTGQGAPPSEAPPARRRVWLRRLAWVAAVFLVLVFAVALTEESLLKAYLTRFLSSRVDMPVTIERVNVSLWQARFELEGLRFLNTPEFGGGVFLHVPSASAELSRGDGTGLHFSQVGFHVAELNLVRNGAGKLNVAVLDRKTENEQPEPEPPAGTNSTSITNRFGGIDLLEVSLRRVSFTDLTDTNNNRSFDLGVTNEQARGLKTQEELNNWLASFLFRLAVQEFVKESGKLK